MDRLSNVLKSAKNVSETCRSPETFLKNVVRVIFGVSCRLTIAVSVLVPFQLEWKWALVNLNKCQTQCNLHVLRNVDQSQIRECREQRTCGHLDITQRLSQQHYSRIQLRVHSFRL